MAKCQFCNEQDESKLILSSRFVNGRVEHIEICFRCFWLDKFKAEGDGKSILQERESFRRTNSERGILKRLKFSSSSVG